MIFSHSQWTTLWGAPQVCHFLSFWVDCFFRERVKSVGLLLNNIEETLDNGKARDYIIYNLNR